MLHHLTLWVPDLERAEESWSWLLGQLGWERDTSVNRVLLFRHAGGSALVLEQSPDMVPGMLHSRFRPGLNHLAFSIPHGSSLDAIASGAGDHGWQPLPNDPHRLIGAERVAYLEDRDGFEVEIVERHPS
jgi:catechol 2,3-dioxygenase-like lactoylglutathione lyase family enzyme